MASSLEPLNRTEHLGQRDVRLGVWLGVVLAGLSFSDVRVAGFSPFLVPLLAVFAHRKPWSIRRKLDAWSVLGTGLYFSLILGSIYANVAGIPTSGAVHSALAYALVAGTLFLLLRLSHRALATASVAASVTIILINSFALILEWSGFAVGTLVGPVWSGARFTGLASNPNQLAIAVVMTPAILLLWTPDRGWKRAAKPALLAAAIVLGTSTASGGLRLAWILAGLVTLVVYLSPRLFRRRSSFAAGLAAILLASVMLYWEALLHLFTQQLSAATVDGGNMRWALYDNGLAAFSASPLFGLGPGAHSGLLAPHEGQLAHNLYIDLAAQAGIVGIGFFAWFVWRELARGVAHFPIEFFGLLSIALYSVGGYPVRHPVVWLFVLLLSARERDWRVSSPDERISMRTI